jgi:uncharacterized protein (DUF1330 family)
VVGPSAGKVKSEMLERWDAGAVGARGAAYARWCASESPSREAKESVMNRYVTLAVGILAGAAIGAAAVDRLNAQAKAPGAYAVIDISEINNPDLFKALLSKADAPVNAFGGKFVVRTEKITAIDGIPPARFVVIGFDSVEKAKEWDNSPAQKEIDDMRHRSAKARAFIVEGATN